MKDHFLHSLYLSSAKLQDLVADLLIDLGRALHFDRDGEAKETR